MGSKPIKFVQNVGISIENGNINQHMTLMSEKVVNMQCVADEMSGPLLNRCEDH